MTLFTDYLYLTDEKEGFRDCRENRSTASNTMTVLFCEDGYIDVMYHNEFLRINKGELFVRIPDFRQTLGEYVMSPDFAFKQVTINADIYDQIMFDHMRVEPNWWAKQEYVKEHPIFPLSEPSRDFFHTYFHLLTLQLQDKQTQYRTQILKLIAHATTMEMLNYLDKLAVITSGSMERASVNTSDYTFHQFTRLLQQYPHKREVQWYAAQLGITPKYLSEICKSRTNMSAGEWIADTTVAELKHYLHNTTLAIRDIAQVMEFPNASFFCQYTKKHTGLTPNKFRKKKDN